MTRFTTLAAEAPAARDAAPCVYYDGGCPLCSREIATYRSARGGQQLQWVDAQACADPELGPALPRAAALQRLHVRLPDGRLVSGAAAFVAIWQRLPAFRGLALLARVPGMLWLMEGLYRGFLVLRPLWRAAPAQTTAQTTGQTTGQTPAQSSARALAETPAQSSAQSLAQSSAQTAAQSLVQTAAPQADAWASWPVALRRELRTDHAGEAGAVMIYRGALAVARQPALRDFAQHHLQTEAQHLALVEAVVPRAGRSRLLPVWRVAGWLTGALPACLGPRAVYATIEAVETFVDQHYAAQLVQIDALLAAAPASTRASLGELRALLAACQHDEQAHRDDARARRGSPSPTGPSAWLASAWAATVGAGSAGAVRVSRWL